MNDLRHLLKLARPWRLRMAAGIALSVVVILSNVTLLSVSGWFIASMALAGVGKLTLEFFTPAAAIRGLAVLRTFARYLERLVTHDATLRLLSVLRVWFYKHLEPLAPARLQDFRDGDLLARLRADIDSLDNFYLRILAPAIAGLISSIAILCVLFWFSPGVAGIDVIMLLLAGVVIPVVVVACTKKSGNDVAGLRASLQVASTDLIRGLGELQVAGAVSRQTRHLSDLSQQLISAQRHQAWISALGSALSALAGQLGMFCTFLFLLSAGQAGKIAGNDFVMLVFAVLASTEAVAALPAAFAALGVTREAARRIFSMAELKPAITLPETSATPEHFDLAFSGVTMRYGPDKPAVLDSLSFSVPEGHCLALLGPSGAGKTTILNLIQGFWDCEGSVTIGGHEVRALSDEVLRQVISVVGQKTYLFNASIRDNLRLVAPDADDDALWQALAKASLEDEIRAFPHGLDTLVGELGARLSGGQARRIAIARAFLSQAPVILLDEPTEGLDATNTGLVLNSLKTLVKGKTTLLVTHQIQPLVLADSRLILE
ncbi:MULTISPECIES: thiol reductant ABC exporter subunit CydC [Tatumella]|uniref:ABC-type xenobiotic transporter n=2 Tax=Tatumella ptyseos TaxID=82987 RepID=A0A085JI28_9GAMM|nr:MULTISPECIES: thiol reductant ABC exporter subunit CydC [Tatumella]KFD20124.1 CydC family ATP-binding transport protein [Tatumella ptyseos ATCC 33301]SQK75794.1 Probable ABC transporter ATP-binding protein HI_0664 [Tatumella ptyseos]